MLENCLHIFLGLVCRNVCGILMHLLFNDCSC